MLFKNKTKKVSILFVQSDANTRFSPFASKGTQLSKFRIAVINAFGNYSEELKLFFDENFRTWMKENKETKN